MSTRSAARRPRSVGGTGSRTPRFYKWKAKYGGLEVSDGKRLKALEDENRRLRKLLAESMLDNAALKDILGKKRLKPAARRLAVARVIEQHGFSQRLACRLIGIDHSVLRYRSKRPDDAPLRQRLRD